MASLILDAKWASLVIKKIFFQCNRQSSATINATHSWWSLTFSYSVAQSSHEQAYLSQIFIWIRLGCVANNFAFLFSPTPSVIPRLGSTDDNSLPLYPRKEYLALGFLINKIEPNAFGYCRWVPQLYASLIQPFLFSSRRRCSSISTYGSAAPLPASMSSQRPWTRCPSSALHISTQTDFNIGLWWKRYRFSNFCRVTHAV